MLTLIQNPHLNHQRTVPHNLNEFVYIQTSKVQMHIEKKKHLLRGPCNSMYMEHTIHAYWKNGS